MTVKSTTTIIRKDRSIALKKVVYTTPEEFEQLLRTFNGNLNKIAEAKQWERSALLNKVRHYEPYATLYTTFTADSTKLIDNKVRNEVNKLKNTILKGFAKLLESGNEKAILQGVKDLITPIIHKQEESDINIQVNAVNDKSPLELVELAQKLLNSEKSEKI